jgi:hypothetical protein
METSPFRQYDDDEITYNRSYYLEILSILNSATHVENHRLIR